MKQRTLDEQRFNAVTALVIAACIEVHRNLGPGLLESAYEECVCYELEARRVSFERQRLIPLAYKGIQLDCGYRADVVVADTILVEIKAVERLLPIHEAQVISYLRLTQLPAALLINFHVPILKQGLRRLIRPRSSASPLLPVKSASALSGRMGTR
jgi:GxxExxY protein